MNIKINHATQKTHKQTQGPTGLYELFLLTVPIGSQLSKYNSTCWRWKIITSQLLMLDTMNF